eukprot:Mrub_06924.p1 GENE.Mrub_06924~~Mrub_06924.p1  ORF type:complete len:309 (+),score=104.97 Mrub_06924:52-927(+)
MIEGITNFLVGSLAGSIATTFIQPIDLVKVRVQIAGEKGESTNPVSIFQNVLKEEGVLAFYKGIDAAISRQLVYAGLRLGLFKSFSDYTSATFYDGKPNPVYMKLVNASLAGGIGAYLANPVDLSLVRMQGENILPAEQRRGYTDVFTTLRKIYKDEGVRGLFQGAQPTVIRAVVMNMAMLTTNDIVREQMTATGYTNWYAVNVTAASVSGVIAAVASLPFDNCKTRLQNMQVDKDGKYPYKNLTDVFMKAIKSRPFSLYDGLPVFIARVAPHAFITLLVNSMINDIRKKL